MKYPPVCRPAVTHVVDWETLQSEEHETVDTYGLISPETMGTNHSALWACSPRSWPGRCHPTPFPWIYAGRWGCTKIGGSTLRETRHREPLPLHPHAAGAGTGAELVLEDRSSVQHPLLLVVHCGENLHLSPHSAVQLMTFPERKQREWRWGASNKRSTFLLKKEE